MNDMMGRGSEPTEGEEHPDQQRRGGERFPTCSHGVPRASRSCTVATREERGD